MSATTGLGPSGVSRAVNASYAGKVTAGGKAAGIYSRLHPGGHSRAWANDVYAGKGGAVGKALGPFSRLHMAGHSRAYAIDSYAGKSPVVPPVDGEGGNFIPVIARRGRRGR